MTPAAVEDLRTEWLDRYGPLPTRGGGARRRRAAPGRVRPHRGDRGDGVGHPARRRGPGRTGEAVARLAPIRLRASARVRLGRLHPRAIVKEEVDQIIVPLPRDPISPTGSPCCCASSCRLSPGDGARPDPDAAAVAAAEALAAGFGPRRDP